MSEQAQERKERYRRVRSDFDDLDTEDKVLFLMEATVSTIARGVDEFGRAVSDELNKAFSRRAEKKERAHREDEAGGSATNGGSSTSRPPGEAPGTSNPSADAPSSDNGSGETS